MPNDTLWTGAALDDLRSEFGDVYDGRTVLVTGADGFMGSHLTDALVELGANVHAFVRATSSGALNNIGHLRSRLKIHFADLTDRTSVDYLVRELKDTASDRPYVFHLGAQAHVGESWHRPYETVAANVLGTLNLLQSVVDAGLELEKFDTAGTSEEYGNVRESVSDHHDFDDEGGLILHERSPINPKSIYATAKVAADFLTMNYHDAFGVPGVVTRMFNNYGPRQNPRYVTGTIITQALTRETIELGSSRSAPRLLLLHRRRPRTPHRRRAGHARRRLRLRPGREHLDARLGRSHPPRRRGGGLLAGGSRDRLGAVATPTRVERGDGAARRPREAHGARPAGSPASRGRKACYRRSAGTPTTETAGSAASTGCPRAHRRSSTDADSGDGPTRYSWASRVQRTMKSCCAAVGRALPEEDDLSVAIEPRRDDVGRCNGDVRLIHAFGVSLGASERYGHPITVHRREKRPRPALAAIGSSLTGS